MTIKQAIFTVESLAHLQGRERELLPVVEAARHEHNELYGVIHQFIEMVEDDEILVSNEHRAKLIELLTRANAALDLAS